SGARSVAHSWLDMRFVTFESLLLALWAVGAVLCCVRYVLARSRLLRIVARAEDAPRQVVKGYNEIAHQLGHRRVPALRITDELDSPALIGLWRPTVLLPRWLVERENDASAHWALRHELAHWKWLDPWAILVRDVVGVLFF